jgi:excisionase family DNA binding protein
MEIITSLTRKELEQLITDSVTKCLDAKLSPPQPEPSDRCGLDDACIILGTPEKPASKAQVYKLTSEKKLPHAKFGSRLVFSRRQLTAWVESHTLPPASAEDEMKARLRKSANKKLRHGQ